MLVLLGFLEMGGEKIPGDTPDLEMSNEVSEHCSRGNNWRRFGQPYLDGEPLDLEWDGGKKSENQQVIFSEKENVYGFLGRIF